MNKLTLLLLVFVLWAGVAGAQEYALNSVDPVNEQIEADTLVNGDQASSVYTVAAGNYYYFDGSLEVDYDLVIEGPDNGWIGQDATPPIMFQTPSGEGLARDMINLNEGGSVELRNILLTGLHPNDVNISSFVRNFGGNKIVWDNCVFTDYRDHATRSTSPTTEITITNCIFINADRRGSSPFGGMMFRLDAECLQLTVENNTLVNGSRLLGNGGNFFTSRMTEIHNTILNQQVNGHEIHWFEAIQANNIYYNWSWRGRSLRTNGYEAPFTTFETHSAVVNKLDSLSIYQGRNSFYLDPAFFDYWNNTVNVTFPNDSDHVRQCFLWNIDVDSTINADTDFTIGKNFGQDFNPMFTNDPSEIDSMLAWDYSNWVSSANHADWRIQSPITWNENGTPNFNWPPAFDLSYSNDYLLTGATDGLPVGDLNWFPSAKADWDANRAAYIAALRDSITSATQLYTPGDSLSAFLTEDEVTAIEKIDGKVRDFYISNNYPNPFNPTTTINMGIPEQSKVTFTVYSILGQKVFELKNQPLTAGQHEVTFDGSQLSSGIYFYKVKAVGVSGKQYNSIKKMTLIK